LFQPNTKQLVKTVQIPLQENFCALCRIIKSVTFCYILREHNFIVCNFISFTKLLYFCLHLFQPYRTKKNSRCKWKIKRCQEFHSNYCFFTIYIVFYTVRLVFYSRNIIISLGLLSTGTNIQIFKHLGVLGQTWFLLRI
jgi:hypothetical protein